MIEKAVSCFIALTLVALVCGTEHEELLAGGYQYFPGVGYYNYGTNNDWMDAQIDCISTKGRLAVINSEEERQTIVSFLSNHTQDDYVYAGFTNQYDTQYVTTEGINLNRTGYTTWETGKPSNYSFRCGCINTKTGELTDLDCDVAMSYVCEHQLWTGYTYIQGIGYYKLHDEGGSWADADDTCESEGAHLLVINSQAEADAVKQIYNAHPYLNNTDSNDAIYVGFRAVISSYSNSDNATFLTIFGSSVSDSGYVKWYGGSPEVDSSFFCGALVRNEMSYDMWYCASRLAFICEKELQ